MEEYSVKALIGPDAVPVRFLADGEGYASRPELVNGEYVPPSVEGSDVDGGLAESDDGTHHKATARVRGQSYDSNAVDRGITPILQQGGRTAGTFLTTFALLACQDGDMGERYKHMAPVLLSAYRPNVHHIRPWELDEPTWYLFETQQPLFGVLQKQVNQFQHCDGITEVQSTLLCAANRLAEVADAVDPVVWNVDTDYYVDTPNEDVVVTFPVQNERDKFILRDQALKLLSHVARLEFYDGSMRASPSQQYYSATAADGMTGSCTDQYAHLLDSAIDRDSAASLADLLNLTGHSPGDALFDANHLHLRDGTGFSNESDFDQFARYAVERIAQRTAILRASNLLGRELLFTSFDADIAGAQKAFGEAATKRSGLLNSWGFEESWDAGSYNSKMHALRLLFGRLEVEGSVATSRPQGILPYPTQRGGIAPSLTFEVQSVPPSNTEQARALSLVRWSGLVLSAYNSRYYAPEARRLFEMAVMYRAKKEFLDVVVSAGEWELSPRRDAIQALVDTVYDGDLHWALDTVYMEVRRMHGENLASNGWNGTPQESYAGLELAPFDSSHSSIPFMVIEGGLPVGEFDNDPLAYLGKYQYASVRDNQASSEFQGSLNFSRSSMQSTFHMGDVFRQALLHARDVASDDGRWGSTWAAAIEPAGETADAGAAESTTWVGHAQVYVLDPSVDYPGNPPTAPWRLDVVGLTPADLGVAPGPDAEAEMTRRLRLVYGPVWGVHCAIGDRQHCPTDGHPGYEIVAGAPRFVDLAPPRAAGNGTLTAPGVLSNQPLLGLPRVGREQRRLRFEIPAGNDGIFNVTSRGIAYVGTALPRPGKVPQGPAQDRFFLVVTKAAGNGPNGARVLTGIHPGAGAKHIISPTVEEMAERLMEHPDASPIIADGSCSHIQPQRERSTCVDIPRDTFVPLANEINSSGGPYDDSWKHYLAQAKAAAERADQLGRELIDRGTTLDLRSEGAQERVSAACGTFVDPIDLSVDAHGVLSAGTASGEVQQCLKDETYDLVFLGENPYQGMTTANIREAAGCSDPLVPPEDPEKRLVCGLPRTDAHGQPRDLSVVGLGLSPPGTYVGGVDCAAIVSKAETPAPPEELRAFGNELYLTGSSIRSAITQYKLSIVDAPPPFASNCTAEAPCPLSWDLQRYGRVIMGTHNPDTKLPNNIYPFCTTEPPSCAGDELCTDSAEARCSTPLARTMMRVFGYPGNLTPSHNEVLKRVQAALWQLGALGGVIPAGTFNMPVPVLQFPTPDGSMPVMGLYTAGWLASTGTYDAWGRAEHRYHAPFPWHTDANDLGTAVHASPSYVAGMRHRASASWRQSLLGWMEAYPAFSFVTLASNAPITFNDVGEPRDWLRLVRSNNLVDITESLWGDYTSDHGATGRNREFCGGTLAESFGGTAPVLKHLFLPVAAEDPTARPIREAIPHASHGQLVVEAHLNRQVQQVELLPSTVADAIAVQHPDCVPSNGHFSSTCGLRYDNREDAPWWVATTHLLTPSECPPSERVGAFVLKEPGEPGANGTLSIEKDRTIPRALALSCLSKQDVEIRLSEAPPEIRTTEDIRVFEAWLDATAQAIGDALGSTTFSDVPKAPVERFDKSQIGGEALGEGAHGRLLQALASDLLAMHSAIVGVMSGLRNMRTQVGLVRLELEAIDETSRLESLRLARDQIEMSRANTHAVIGLMSAAVSGAGGVMGMLSGDFASISSTAQAGFSATQAGLDLMFNGQVADNMSEQATVQAELRETSTSTALANFGATADAIWRGVSDDVIRLQTAANGLLSTQISLRENQRSAAFAMAQATGADYLTSPDTGELVPLPVNTTLRRLFSVTNFRYRRALQQAKRAAYIARLAIEQRLGVRLADLGEIGPNPHPSTWLDNVCTATGIDYQALRAAKTDVPGSTEPTDESKLVEDFADEYIGDYVARLEELVEFYNIEFPAKESDDYAVLSLREDLLQPNLDCTGDSPNLLLMSHSLHAEGDLVGDASLRGWHTTACLPGEAACLRVHSGGAVGDSTNEERPWDIATVAPPDGSGGVSWLHLVDGERSDSTDVVEDLGLPRRTVYQTIDVEAGFQYILSWQDMARGLGEVSYDVEGADGRTSSSAYPVGSLPNDDVIAPYAVTVYDEDWGVVERGEFVAEPPLLGAAAWSGRIHIGVLPHYTGKAHVAFSLPTRILDGAGASVAIANVQFERQSFFSAEALPYVANGKSRVQVSTHCQDVSPESFRARFERRCEGGSGFDHSPRDCYWELDAPIAMDTGLLNRGIGGLAGRVARGNHNFRHVSTAVNLVGTGVLDCTNDPSDSCYATGYAEYDLEHQADNAPIVDYDGDVSCFDFRTGKINSGKALATERYITLPVSTEDTSLIEQEAVRRSEFHGRPLSGRYRLRIKDSPAFAFDRLEDVQLVLRYRYWSRVERPDTRG